MPKPPTPVETTLIDVAEVTALPPTRPRCARLIVLVGTEEGRVHQLESPAVVGRGENADFRLADPAISRHHARIERVADDVYEIVDLDSRNGTFLDGEPITRTQLEPGSRIQLGPRCLLLFTLQHQPDQRTLQAQQIELMAQMAAGFSHDFNNLLCTITANAAHLRELPAGMSLGNLEVRECLDDLHAAAQEGAELTGRLEPFAMSASSRDSALDLSMLATRRLDELRKTLPRGIRLRVRIQEQLFAFGRQSAMEQLLLHACLNARDAMPDGGTLAVELARCAEAELPLTPMLVADDYAVLSVRDTGVGVDAATCERAFDPFFTTKEVAVGSGLGLTIVRKIAHDLGGSARLDSTIGEGTTLTVVIPIRTDARSSSMPPIQQPRRPTSDRVVVRVGRTTLGESDAESVREDTKQPILVVDDNDAIRRVVVRALQRRGYPVLEARDGLEALEVFEQASGLVTAAVLDLDMPRMGGRECLQALRKRAPGLPVVVLSGLVDPNDRGWQGAESPDLVLSKPIDPIRLLDGIEGVLEPADRRSDPPDGL